MKYTSIIYIIILFKIVIILNKYEYTILHDNILFNDIVFIFSFFLFFKNLSRFINQF